MKRQVNLAFIVIAQHLHLTRLPFDCCGSFRSCWGYRSSCPEAGEGVESVDGFCRGLNGLDELADISSQLLNRKFPMLGPIRVSCFLNNKFINRWVL